MIATLNFEKSLPHAQVEPELTPGLRRIDELLAVVLARYEQADYSGSPGQNADRFCRSSFEIPTDQSRKLAKVHPK